MFRRSKQSTPDSVCDEPIITITEEARRELLSVRAEDPQAADLALWIEVTGVEGDEYTYNMYFDLFGHAGPQHRVLHQDDLSIVIPQDSVEKVRGASIYLAGGFGQGGWAIDNPNKPSPAVAPMAGPAVAPSPGRLSGDVAQRVHQVLDLQVNPSIAAHGGRADLVAVEDQTAYLRLSGGCQGCGMARVTLGQGIEVAIKQAVPEIVNVVDVTDHASGTNPYFEAAKK